MKLFAIDVFTPNDFPAYTYVQRAGDDLEKKLQRALDTPKVVVSISGPSKSGKTVLVEKLVGKDNLIPVSGAEVQIGEDLWVARSRLDRSSNHNCRTNHSVNGP